MNLTILDKLCAELVTTRNAVNDHGNSTCRAISAISRFIDEQLGQTAFRRFGIP